MLQIYVQKTFFPDDQFLDSLHKSFLNQATLNLRKEKRTFLNREFTVILYLVLVEIVLVETVLVGDPLYAIRNNKALTHGQTQLVLRGGQPLDKLAGRFKQE